MRSPIRTRLIAASVAALTTVTYAGSTLASTTSLTSGSLTGPSTSSMALGDIGVLDLAATQTTDGVEKITVQDNRGKGTGWRVSVAASDFEASGIADPTGSEGATLTVTLPAANVLTAAVSKMTHIVGQHHEGVTYMSTPTTVTNAGITLLHAPAGYGMGHYEADIDFTFTLPKTVAAGNVVSSDETTSIFKPGNTVTAGIFAGTYATTVTYTTSNTP